MLNFFVNRQSKSFLLAPLLQIFLVSVGADKAIAIHPCHYKLFTPLSPERLYSPPFKDGRITLAKIAIFTCWKHVPLTEVGTTLALWNNVINRQLFFPFSTIRASTLPEWSPQKIVFKNALAKSTFCVTRAKFNERIKQLIRTIRSWHGTI